MGNRTKDLSGFKFNKLTPTTFYIEIRNNKKVCFWKCQCDCGNVINVRAGGLTSGNTQSCGCLKIENNKKLKLPPGVAILNRKYKKYIKGAHTRNYIFNITIEQFKLLVTSDCYYCANKANPFNGLDRLNNNEGYILENVVPCCTICNFMKGKLDYKTFINHTIKISDYVRSV